MRRIRYSVAASLDGYIAGPHGEYDWIPMDPDIDFAAMMAQYDTYVMGRGTYEALPEGGGHGPGDVFVFSTTLRQEDHPKVTIVAHDVAQTLNDLRARPGKDIWLFGGGILFRNLLELGQVDAVEVAVIPILLGGGIPLLPAPSERARLSLTGHRLYEKSGIMMLEYAVRRTEVSRGGRRGRRGS